MTDFFLIFCFYFLKNDSSTSFAPFNDNNNDDVDVAYDNDGVVCDNNDDMRVHGRQF